jgi:hypothetical protein
MNGLSTKSGSIFSFANEISRKRYALSFRKTLGVYNYKIKGKSYFKNPHGVKLELYTKLKESKTEIDKRKLAFLEGNSNTPYGKSTRTGNFKFDFNRVPIYNIPDVNNFYLKPFVSKNVCRIFNREPEDYTNGEINEEILNKIKIQLLLSDNKEVRSLGLEMFETEFGKEQMKEFLISQKNGKFFDRQNMKFTQNRQKIREKITLMDFYDEDGKLRLDENIKAIEQKSTNDSKETKEIKENI